MLGLNSTHYIGSVTSKPELKYTPGGMAILELTVAGRTEVVTADGAVKNPSFYNRCKCFGKYAETLSESVEQGQVVSVHGRLEQRSYEVEGGARRSTVETVIETIQTLSGNFVLEDDARSQPVLIGGLNSVTLGGNLTKDAELKPFPTGNSVVRLSVAVNERYVSKGEVGEKVGFFDVQAWGELANSLAEGAKGHGVIGVGRVVNESWEDQDGTKRYGTKIDMERAYFVAGGSAKTTPASQPQRAQQPQPHIPVDEEFPPEEDLPF